MADGHDEVAGMAGAEETRFRELTQALMDLKRGLAEKTAVSKKVMLEVSREDLSWYQSELLSCFSQIENSNLRFDIVHFICELIEDAFYTAAKAGLSVEDFDEAKKVAAKEFGAAGGLRAAVTSRMKALKWQDPCLEKARETRAKSPTMSTKNLASIVHRALDPAVEEDTVLKLLQKAEADERLPRKSTTRLSE